MTLTWIKKFLTMLFSILAGLLISGFGVTVVVSILNYLAEDGPYFPSALIAFFLVAPVMVLLTGLEIGVVVYEGRTGRIMGNALAIFVLVGGLGGGLLHAVLIDFSINELNIMQLGLFLAFGMLAGLTVFGVHRLSGFFWAMLERGKGL
jgi:hypothetical protein